MQELINQALESVVNLLQLTGEKFLTLLPGMLIAFVIIILGYILAVFSGFIVKYFLNKVKLDQKLRRADLADSIGRISLGRIFGLLTKWMVFLLFLNEAVHFLKFGALTTLLEFIVSWLPNLIVSIVLLIVGLIVVDLIHHKLLEIENAYVSFFSGVIKVTLIIVIIFTALKNLGLQLTIAENIFLMILGALLLTVSLAMGIGFGFGIKDEAKSFLKLIRKKLK